MPDETSKYNTIIVIAYVKPWPNDRNNQTQYIATLLGRRVACV